MTVAIDKHGAHDANTLSTSKGCFMLELFLSYANAELKIRFEHLLEVAVPLDGNVPNPVVTEQNQTCLNIADSLYKQNHSQRHKAAMTVFKTIMDRTGNALLAEPWGVLAMTAATACGNIAPQLDAARVLMEKSRQVHDEKAMRRWMVEAKTWVTRGAALDGHERPLLNLLHVWLETLGDLGEYSAFEPLLQRADQVVERLKQNSGLPRIAYIVFLLNGYHRGVSLLGLSKLAEALKQFDTMLEEATQLYADAQAAGQNGVVDRSYAAWMQLIAVGGQIRTGIADGNISVVNRAEQRLQTIGEVVANLDDIPAHVKTGYPALWTGMIADFRAHWDEAYQQYNRAYRSLGREKLYADWAYCLRELASVRPKEQRKPLDPERFGELLSRARGTGYHRHLSRASLAYVRELIRWGCVDEAQNCLERFVHANPDLSEKDTVWAELGFVWAELWTRQGHLEKAQAKLDTLLTTRSISPVTKTEAHFLLGTVLRGQQKHMEASYQFQIAAIGADSRDIHEIAVQARWALAELFRTTRDNPPRAVDFASGAVRIAMDLVDELSSNEVGRREWLYHAGCGRLLLVQALAELGAKESIRQQLTWIFDRCTKFSDDPRWRGLYGRALLEKTRISYQYRTNWRLTGYSENPAAKALRLTELGIRTCVDVGDFEHAALYLPQWARLRIAPWYEAERKDAAPEATNLSAHILAEFDDLCTSAWTEKIRLKQEFMIHVHVARALCAKASGEPDVYGGEIQSARNLWEQLGKLPVFDTFINDSVKWIEAVT
ncbi:MAG: hypothetical protein HUU55_03865 [Myxococcales bacterium]|nr:hypothetical protein [Myxococcales bacterium]